MPLPLSPMARDIDLEVFIYYFHSQDGKISQLTCFLTAYLSHILRPKAIRSHHFISSTLFFGVELHSLSPRLPISTQLGLVDQILLFQYISDGFNKPKLGYWTIFDIIDFFKAFDCVWHPALFYKLISASLSPCFVQWN